jgi:riboflavin kinase
MPEIKLQHILTLAELLVRGARNNYIEITTRDLGKTINRSQQAASKHLLDLENDGFVHRVRKGQGFRVRVTEKGYEEMSKLFISLKSAMESAPNHLEFMGVAVSGMGEGAYYMSQLGYKEQFIKKLGFDPYPGTLNIKLSEQVYVDAKRELDRYPAVFVDGFSDGKRTYGWVKCYPATINNKVDGALLILERTHHDDSVIEVIAPVRIKDIVNIRDGDRINVSVKIPDNSSSTRRS